MRLSLRRYIVMIRKGFGLSAVVALLALLAAATFGAKILQYKFSSAGEFPGAPLTIPLADSLTQIAGYYIVSPGPDGQFGYVQTALEKSRTPFLSLQPPGGWFAFAAGVNNHGIVVGGSCVPPQQCNYPETTNGFSYSNGVFTAINYPGALSTGAFGINDLGQIVGGYCLTVTVCGQSQIATDHGFLDSNGTFTELDYPGARNTQAMAINKTGVIVGEYDDPITGGPHSFLYQNGQYKIIDFPGALSTHASAINNAGVVAGYYELPTAQVLGFIYNKGQFYTVMHLGPSTGLSGINDRDIIVGTYSPPIGLQLTFKGVPIK